MNKILYIDINLNNLHNFIGLLNKNVTYQIFTEELLDYDLIFISNNKTNITNYNEYINFEFYYLLVDNILKPYVSVEGGYFLGFLNEDFRNNGIINVVDIDNQKNYNITYNIWGLNINYILNKNNLLSVNEQPIIEYFINYEPNDISIIYGQSAKSVVPITNLTNNSFNISNLIEGISIDKNTGIISFSNKININNYQLIIKSNETTCIYTITTIQTIKYNPSILILTYNQLGRSVQPVLSKEGGIFTCDKINYITIDSNGILFFDSNIDIGIYNINVTYQIDDSHISTIYKLNVVPLVNYNNITTTLSYEDPIIMPEGEIIDSNLNNDVGIYNVKILNKLDNYNHNQTNLTINIKPVLNYTDTNLEVDYQKGKIYYSEKPLVKPVGGVFKIQGVPVGITIDSDGIIKFNNILPSTYNFSIYYTKNKATVSVSYKLVVKPIISYIVDTFIYGSMNKSSSPNINYKGGYYSSSEVQIDKNTGIIFINNKLDIGTHTFNITYINTTIIYTCIIIPSINYLNNNVKTKHLDKFISDKPIVNPSGGSFNINSTKINIDKTTGIIETDNLDIGNYSFIINYINTSINYNITVEPVVYYDFHEIEYGSSFTIKPIIQDIGGTFDKDENIITDNLTVGNYEYLYKYTLNDVTIDTNALFMIKPKITYENPIIYYSNDKILEPTNNFLGGIYNLIDNFNIIIDQDTGFINLKNLDLGSYNLIVNYKINDVLTSIPINIEVKPLFYYNDIKKAVVCPLGGTFTYDTLPNGINIDNQGNIIIDDNISVGKYNLTINYNVNNYTSTIDYILNIEPSIEYKNNIILYYGDNYLSEEPIINQSGGYFYFEEKNDEYNINISTGIISIICNSVGIFKIKIIYILNNIKKETYFNFIVKPKISKIENKEQILYKEKYEFIPIVSPIDCLFMTKSSIKTETLDVGKYSIELICKYNDISSNIIYDFTIMPSITYYPAYSIIEYESNCKSVSPIINSNKGKFSIKDFRYSIDENGILTFNKIDIGIYDININFICNKISIDINYKLQVVPIFYYKDNKPYVNPTGYNFFADLPIDVYLDEKTGIVKSDIVGIYNLNINYGLLDNYNTVKYELIVKPIFTYNETDINILYGTDYIIYPKISDFGGKFYIKDSINSEFCQEDSGLINLKNFNVGNYNLKIFYKLNDVEVSSIIKLNIDLVFYYDIDTLVINYDEGIKYSIKPIVKPSNGIFYCEDKLININSEGIIKFPNFRVGKYHFKINYKINDKIKTCDYKLIVNPIIYYEEPYKEIYYFEKYKQEPIIKPLGGIIKFDKQESTILASYTLNKLTVMATLTIKKIPFLFYKNTTFYYNNLNVLYPIFVSEEKNNFSIECDIKNISINNEGIITIPQMLDVGRYNGIVTYNNIKVKFNFIIKPILTYENYKISSNCRDGEYSSDSLEIDIDKSTGIFKVKNIIGNHNVIILYVVNNIISKIYLNIMIKPKLSYNIETCYNTEYVTEKPNISDKYTCDNLPLNALLNEDTGVITITDKVDVGYYNFILNPYIEYSIKVKPYINYLINEIIIPYGQKYISNIPKVNPDNGIFKLNKKIPEVFLCSNGQIIISKNLEPKRYIFEITYTINDISSLALLILIIKPNIKYQENIILKQDYHQIKPLLVQPIGGIFLLNNESLEINMNDKTGDIIIDDNLTVGNYELNISYVYNYQIANFIINLLIMPVIHYMESNLQINYNENCVSCKPYVSTVGGLFYIDENDLITIDHYSGILSFNNLPINKYKIVVKYIVYSIEVSTVYNLTVNPVFYYQDNNKYISYEDNLIYTTDIPITYPSNGIYVLKKYNSDVKINEINGKIIINVSGIKNYEIDVIFSYEKKILFTKYILNVLPSVIYNNTSITLKYQTLYTSGQPKINPYGGIFYTTDLPNGCYVNKFTGIIKINEVPIGSYTIIINYKINQNAVSIPYYINII